MLVMLLDTPQTAEDWARWAFHHRQDHAEIGQAIQTQKNTTIVDRQLDPIPADLADWSERHQQMHYDEDNATGVQPAQIGPLDPKSQALRDWIEAHYQNHFDKRSVLKI